MSYIELSPPIKNGFTPAWTAARKGQIKVLEFLRVAGADLNKADMVCSKIPFIFSIHATPFIYVAQNIQKQTIHVLDYSCP